MDILSTRYCLSLLLLTSIQTNANSDGIFPEEFREPRVSGRIVKLYSGIKPEPFLCPGEGFQPDTSNCAVFYRCVKERSGKFTVFRYQCAPGTVYDSDLETCNHPRNTRRPECGGMMKLTSEPTQTTNINEIIVAQSEIPRPISTKTPIYTDQTTFKHPTTPLWNLSSEGQNTPTKLQWASTSYNSPSTLAPSKDKTTNKSGFTSIYPWASTKYQVEFTTPSKITQSQSQNTELCKSDGFIGDNENCRKFYRCVGNQRGGYVRYEFSCSELTVWDDDIQGCNHPWAVKRSKCGKSLSYDDKYTSQKTDNIPNETLNTQGSIINNGGYGYKSNVTVQQQMQISYESTNTPTPAKITNQGQAIQNEATIQNVHRNKGVQTQLEIDNSKDAGQYKVQIQNTTESLSFTEQTNNVDSNECSETGFMGDNHDCKKFYRCVNNGKGSYKKFEYNCGDGTVWDAEIEACNHAWAVKNCGGKGSSNPSLVRPFNTTTTTSKSTVTHTESTMKTQTYYTTKKTPDIDDEDNIGYGNQNNQDSTSSSTTMTTLSTENSNQATNICMSSGFIGDTNDCQVFYRCVSNGNGKFTKYEFKCGDGTLWDQNIEACNHAWAVKNCGGINTSHIDKDKTTTKQESTTPETIVQTTVTLTQVTNETPMHGDDYDNGYGSQHVITSTLMTTTRLPQEHKNNSECKSNGFIGDENDCKKFYRCVDDGNGKFIRYEFTCGEGTVWDPKIEACNHIWAVAKCGGSNNIDDNMETSSQVISSTNQEDKSSTSTTQAGKDTDKPIKTTNTIPLSSTTAYPSTAVKCSSSGFMGDDANCKKFYRCVDNGDGSYTRYEFACGEGTVWDPKIEACNHAWAVEKCGGSSEVSHDVTQQTTSQKPLQDEEQDSGYATMSFETTEKPQTSTTLSNEISAESSHCSKSGFIGDKNDCKKFYRCVDNGHGGYNQYEFTCGEGTLWDGSIEACNHAWAVTNCGTSVSSTTQVHNESTTPSSSSSQIELLQSTEITTTTTEKNHENEVSGNYCVQEGFYGNKNDCRKFYRCVDNSQGGFIKYEFTCGEGTSWNQDIQGCDHTSIDRPCGDSNQNTMHLNDDINTQTTFTTVTTTSVMVEEGQNMQVTKKPQLYENTCESEGFYGNTSDCKKFYRCVENGNGGYTKYEFSCGDGSVWNQDILACDHEPADKTCLSSTSSQAPATVSHLETTTSSHYTTQKQESTDKTETTESNSRECTSEGFYAHPKDCRKFIRCVDNGKGGYTKYEFSCGDGTIWVQEIQACDHDNDITSCSAQPASTSKPQNNEEHLISTSNASFISSTEGTTPNREDDEYDPENSKEPSYDDTDHCSSEGYFGNQQDCRKFYRCVDNGHGGYTKYDFVCGEGTAWDSDLQTCNHMDQVQSCTSSNQDNGINQTTTNKNQAETGSSSTTEAISSSSSSGSSVSSSNSQDKCQNEGYFGDSKDCKKFYRCVDNGKGGYTKYDFICGDGTIWDQDITNCNHPQNVLNPSCTSEPESGENQSTTISSTSSLSSQTTLSTTENTNGGQSTSGSSQASSKTPQNNNITCDKAGYYANPNDCKKFYRCVDWDGDGKRFSVFHFECGEGTIWDPALDTCNYEDSVYPPRDCSHSQSQNVGGETTTPGETTSTTTTTESIISQQTTAQESTTSEQTTTQQLGTNEPTTTAKSNNEQTTTQQSSSENTTNQETSEYTTTEQTTSQQTTASEKTTTQETLTSDQTTTQQTTSQQTTTQQTTTQQTTTQQTTTQQTTTQQTTSEKTTTQESIASEQTTESPSNENTTSQESTTSEHTTTQQLPTSEQTTIEESTISEKPTTATESTTNEQTTSQQSTTTDDSTQASTSEQSTTNDQTTTQQPTTTEQTTTEQSNKQTTEQSSTTTEQATEGTTTTETSNQSTTQASSTDYDSTQDPSTTEPPSSDKTCPEVEDDQYVLVCPTSFKRHPKYCNMFYQCIEDEDTYEAKVATFKCPNNTIYDESQTQCVTENKADKKCDGEIANKRRFKRLNSNYKDPIVADKEKKSCSAPGYFPFEKKSECSKGFLKCEKNKYGKIRGHVYQCPDGYIYWSISKRCERIENVRDCKRSFNDWTGRWNIPIERRNIALS